MKPSLRSVPSPSDEPVDMRQELGDCALRTVATRASPRACFTSRPEASVNYRGPSESFIRRGRNPEIEPPARFEPTVKAEGDVVL